MENKQDAYGHEILDFLNGTNLCETVERDDGYLDVSTLLKGYFDEYKDWPSHQKKAIRLARGKVLDIGCGAGRHALHLQGKGFDVLGIDQSPLAVKVCRKRGLKKARIMSITRIPFGLGPFDTLLMMGNNFGLFGGFKRARWLLRRFRSLTTDSGRIIAETVDPYQTKDPVHLAYHKRNRARGRMPGQVRIRVRYHNFATPWFDYLFASKKELMEILDGTGWRINRFIDSEGPVYVAVMEKEKN